MDSHRSTTRLPVHAHAVLRLIRGNSTWVDERYLARPHSSSRLSPLRRSDTCYRWYPALTILIPEHFGARASCRKQLYTAPCRFTKPFKPLTSPNIHMNSSDVLKQLRGFDRASPQFHKHLSDFLRSEGYQSALPSLQGEDLAWLVEYLDSVSIRTISP